VRKHVLTVALGDPRAIDAFVAARLLIDPERAQEWVRLGAVQVGGRRADLHTRLLTGMRVIIREPAAPEELEPLAVIYRDDDLLVVDKPAGMLSQPSANEAASSLEARVQRELPEARLMHRLDREASGLVLFALRPVVHAALQHDLENDAVTRHYLAIASGVVTASREIKLRIARDSLDARRRIALPENADGGKPARTKIVPIGWSRDGTRLRVELHTGRTHQIRVHCAAIDHPLVGDDLYGGPPGARLMLHATHLALPHPTTGDALELDSPAPPELA
jgi:23S rRNA pseudouridine1911/1915/1917 synthase